MVQRRRKIWSVVVLTAVLAGMWAGIAVAGWGPRLGLDLQGGISVTLTPTENPEALEKAVDIIRDRVDALGVAEPEIAREGENILVQLPGVKEQSRALEIIGRTAKLTFRPVLEEIAPGAPAYATTGPKDCGDPDTYPQDDPEKEVVFCVRTKVGPEQEAPPSDWPKLRLGPVALEGSDVARADGQIDPGGATGWYISLRLTGEGSRKFEEVTGDLACKPLGDATRQLAITLDRVVESNPQIGEDVTCNQGIAGGSATITGTFTEREAKDLALVLRYGALPVELEPSAVSTVSPTLGRDSLRAGLIAGGIGLVALLIYVLLFYRVLGVVAFLGLLLHGGVTLGVVILLGQTVGFALTLAGIAGLIVSLGVATDSFIVYFERIKDEMHEGRSLRAAVDRAWTSARRTIIAADLVTALAAVVLYLLAVGGVRGFALMLGLATGLDLLVSFFFMHPVVWLLAQRRRASGSRAFGVHVAEREPAPVAGGQR